MIHAENLTKRYSGRTAVDGISFEVAKGEIVGFLGPNGAGKSTTMKMLASYLPPTSGRATIAGHDVFTDSLRARRKIGYLPENVPLYTDMRVHEYLTYRAGIKEIPRRELRDRLGDVKALCGLEDVSDKMIGSLSKGYRQRVGLADSLIHEPELLILDEPTIGLDPNQIRQVRELIRNLGSNHTILLSTHILSEVEMTCSRVLIISEGRIRASDTPANLLASLRSARVVTLEVKPPGGLEYEHIARALCTLPGVKEAPFEEMGDGWCKFKLRVDAGTDARERVFHEAVSNNLKVRELTGSRATLEDVFVELTHKD